MPDPLRLYETGLWGSGGGMTLATGLRSGYFFEMPTSAAMQGSARKAWAHYMPTWPLSIENKDGVADPTEYYTRVWMPPGAAEGTTLHQEYGGLTRDRPVPRGVRPEPSGVTAWPDTTGASWQKADMLAEVGQAYDMGLDGFILLSQSTRASTNNRQGKGPYWLLQACIDHGKGMKCVLMPDMSTGMGALDQVGLAAEMAAQAAYPSAYRLPDGRLVVMPYKAEKKTVAWWDVFQSTMLASHGIVTAFWPSFTSSINTYRSAFAVAKNIYGMTTWGNSHATGNPVDESPSTTNPYGQGKSVLDLGLHWCHSARLQDHRPYAQVFWEPEGSKNYRNTWQIAQQLQAYDPRADWVQVTTWNDYAEGSGIAPTLYNTTGSMAQLNAYFAAWWKTGVQPKILHDALFLIHRVMPFGESVQSPDQVLFMTRSAGTANYLYAEALVFTTAPASVTLDSGSNQTVQSVPAGISVVRVALGLGTQHADITRAASTVVSVTSDFPVATSPLVQDYHQRIKFGASA